MGPKRSPVAGRPITLLVDTQIEVSSDDEVTMSVNAVAAAPIDRASPGGCGPPIALSTQPHAPIDEVGDDGNLSGNVPIEMDRDCNRVGMPSAPIQFRPRRPKASAGKAGMRAAVSAKSVLRPGKAGSRTCPPVGRNLRECGPATLRQPAGVAMSGLAPFPGETPDQLFARAQLTLAGAKASQIRENNRIRSIRRREKNRPAAAVVRAPAAAYPFTGLEVATRSMRKYRDEDLEWIIRVGTCPSAGAARAPLAGVISHVACEISRWSVELYRSRSCRYMLQKEGGIWGSFLRSHALGIVLRFDETPMRLYVNGRLSEQGSTMVKCVCALAPGGSMRRLAPKISQPASKGASGLLGALAIDTLGIDVMCDGDTRWKFLLVLTDGAAPNKAVVRRIVKHYEKYPCLLIVHGLCWAHILSNSTKASLGGFSFGQWLRLGHILQARPLCGMREHCRRMLIADSEGPDEVSVANLAIVWPTFVRFMCGSRGPFGAVGTRPIVERLSEIAMKVFPAGPPHVHEGWSCPSVGNLEDYHILTRALFQRHPPMPIASRWYTVEQMGWYVLGLYSFSFLDVLLPTDLEMTYWPGEAEVDGDPAVCRAKSSARVQSLRDYISRGQFVSDMLVACISSLPRWRCAMLLEADGTVPAAGSVPTALAALLLHTRGILSGDDAVAEYFINREEDHLVIRASVWRALATTVLYLGEKDSAYKTDAWRVIRGEISPDELEAANRTSPCCADSGLVAKIDAHFATLSGEAAEASAVSLRETLGVCNASYAAKGGCSNVESERALSICRTLGLKLHHRPPKISTLWREQILKYYLSEQRSWFDLIAKEAFGGVGQMREALRRRPMKFNAFTAFAHSMHAMPNEVAPIWQRLDASTKSRWADIARRHNADDAAERGETAEALAAFSERGPLGSVDRRCPIDKDDLAKALRCNDSDLARQWKRSEIKEWVSTLDKTCPLDVLTGCPKEIWDDRVLLPGDKCHACEVERTAMLRELRPLRDILPRLFKEQDGRRVGLTVGIVWDIDEPIMWFDVLYLVGKPERFLACRLEIISVCDFEHHLLGATSAPLAAIVSVPESFDGRSACLLDFCRAAGRGCPRFLAHARKIGVSSTANGWVAEFPGTMDVDVVETQDVGTPAAASVRVKRRRKFVGRDLYDRIFGDVGDSGDAVELEPFRPDGDLQPGAIVDDDAPLAPGGIEDDDGRLFGDATVSETEIGNHLRNSTDDCLDLSSRLNNILDTNRYGCYVARARGVVTTFWKVSEKNMHRRQYRKAVIAISQVPGARPLRASRSSLRSRYSFDECVERALDWQVWHACWVYGGKSTRQLPASMILPSTVGASSANAGGNSSDDGLGACSSSDADGRKSDWDTSSMSSTSEGTLTE